ncbi:MAG: inorganic diphosphatase, partial [Chloroflexota bacterium]
ALGMLKMIDKGEPDYKVLAVPSTDPFFQQYLTFDDIPRHYLEEVKHFFMTYKQLEGATVENQGWVGTEETKEAITRSIHMYRDKFPRQGTNL